MYALYRKVVVDGKRSQPINSVSDISELFLGTIKYVILNKVQS